jgi:hypothetical protein
MVDNEGLYPMGNGQGTWLATLIHDHCSSFDEDGG